MNKYILKGTKVVIETTEERYNNQFKDLGYVPYKEEPKKIEVKKTSKK